MSLLSIYETCGECLVCQHKYQCKEDVEDYISQNSNSLKILMDIDHKQRIIDEEKGIHQIYYKTCYVCKLQKNYGVPKK